MAVVTADRRTQLLEVAAPLMAERGFHGVSIGELGAAAGVSGPALYRHFPNKQAILGALLTDISEQLLSGGQACVADSDSSVDALDRLVRWHVDFATIRPELIRVQDRDFSSMSKSDQRIVRKLQRRYVELWVEQVIVAEPEWEEESVRARIHATFGLLNSTPYSADRLSRVAAVDLLRKLALVVLTTGAN